MHVVIGSQLTQWPNGKVILWAVILLCCIYHYNYAQVDKHSDGSIKGGLAKNIELNGNNEMFLFDKVEDKRLGNAVS